MNPGAAYFASRTIGEDRGIFDRDIALIVEPVRDPAAQRFGRNPALIHRHMKGMFIVISAPSDRADFRDKSFAIQKSGSHNASSNPSHAISIPACSTCLRSLEPGMRIGLVLLMWV